MSPLLSAVESSLILLGIDFPGPHSNLSSLSHLRPEWSVSSQSHLADRPRLLERPGPASGTEGHETRMASTVGCK